MVEAGSHLTLHPISTFDINKVFELIDMLFMGIWYEPYTENPSYLLKFWGSGSGSLVTPK